MRFSLIPSPLVFCLAGLFAAAMLVGCRPAVDPQAGKSVTQLVDEAAQVSPDALRKQIDTALEFTIQKRRLNTKDQAAWQVVHGALAFGKEFPVRNGEDDVPAIDYLLKGGTLRGWNLVSGDPLDAEKTRFGIRALVERGSLTGQGHVDQWLGYLSGCGFELDTKIVVEGKEHTIADYIEQVERDVFQNTEHEFSWTLMALSTYRPTTHTWTAGDGSSWSIAKIVDYELEHDLLKSTCGGMHRLCGLTMARNRHRDSGGAMEGTWAKCDTRVKEALSRVREYQNPDGSLSANFLARTGTSVDLPGAMHAGGHTLEFVILASNDDELREPWVERAVVRLCDLFRKTKPIDLECGALYHAAHGLAVYRERMFGGRSYLAAAE